MLVELFVGVFLILVLGMGVGGVRVDTFIRYWSGRMGVLYYGCSIKEMMGEAWAQEKRSRQAYAQVMVYERVKKPT